MLVYQLTVTQFGIAVEVDTLDNLIQVRDFCDTIARNLKPGVVQSAAEDSRESLAALIDSLKEANEMTARKEQSQSYGISLKPPRNGAEAQHGRATSSVPAS